MRRSVLAAAFVALPLVAAECPNACSGNGECGANDACICYDSFSGADCSLKSCPWGFSFVDVPAGDLNHDGVQGATTASSSWALAYSQVQWSTYKQAEYWPTLAGYTPGTAGNYKADGTGVDPATLHGGGWAAAGDEAHFYAECSGKGDCDRSTGTCVCVAGYEGAACQRTTCPSDCSGHGVCRTVREISATKATKRLIDSAGGVSTYSGPQDFFTYRLWDADKNRACSCDAGYTGYDCSLRECPRGDDPLTAAPSTCGGKPCVSEVQAFAIGGNQASGAAGAPVNYKLVFYDYNGFKFVTRDFGVDTYLNYGAPANAAAKLALQADIKAALEALPNAVAGTVSVTVSGDGTSVGGDANIRVLVAFTTLSGNVPDMNVIPGTAVAGGNAAGTPAVAQPFNRIQVLQIDTAVGAGYKVSAAVFPLNATAIRKDTSLGVDDTASLATVTVGASTAAGVAAAVVSAVQAIPAVAYYGANTVSAAASASGSTYTVYLVLPNANFGANPLALTVKTAGNADVTSTVVKGISQLSVDGNKEHSVCANRGLCDYTTGLCSCFHGYYGNACETQSALAM